MMRVIRIMVLLLAVVEGIVWTVFVMQLAHWRGPMGGAGDGAGGGDGSSSAALFAILLIGAIWLLLTSPYICMALGSLNLITGKSLRVAYVYSLVVLSIMTLILLVTLQRRLELMALGNIVAVGLWAYGFRENTTAKEKPETPV
jgi:hypothetical protein